MRTFAIGSLMLLAIVVVGQARPVLANAPAPWWACEGKTDGQSCDPYGSGSGVCRLQAECTDDTATTVNECLYCEKTGSDGCSMGGREALAGWTAAAILAALALGGLTRALLRRRG